MLPKYNTRMALADAEACDAVALLMRDVGVSVNMQYTSTSSGAQTFMAAKALKTYSIIPPPCSTSLMRVQLLSPRYCARR